MKTIACFITCFLFITTGALWAQGRTAAGESITEAGDLCTSLNKLILSGRDFKDIKGKVMRTADTIAIYESSVTVPGSNETAVYASSSGTPSVIASLIQTATKEDAEKKYYETLNCMNTCNYVMGTLMSDEDKTLDAKTTLWVPFGLSEENKSMYQNFVLELVFEKDLVGKYVVFIRMSYIVD